MIEQKQNNIENLSDEALLKLIWDDKNGRAQRLPRFGLFVALDNPKPNLAVTTKRLLQALLENPDYSQEWAETWGKVVVCVGPAGKLQCILREESDDKNRSLIKLESNSLLSPADLITDFPQGKGATIVLNSQPTTVEAFIISYVHMVDELIWTLCQKKLRQNPVVDHYPATNRYLRYSQALQEVIESGFNIKVADTKQILDLKRNNLNISVRLYGSKVNKQVPSVMGAVILNPDDNSSKSSFLNDLPVIEELDILEVNPADENSRIAEKTEPIKPVVVTSVTFGKELHAGHMLLLATADLLRFNLGNTKPLVLINNNTGPRSAATLVALSEETDKSIDEIAVKLSQTELPCDKLISAYRSRRDSGELFNQAVDLLESGKFDIFASLSRRVRNRLSESGFQTAIIAESESLSLKDRMLQKVNPIWAGSGFCFLPHLREVRIVQKNGLLTATGKATTSLISIAKQSSLRGENPLLAFVDSAKDAQDACLVFSKLNSFGTAVSVAGAGISFNGELASGSKGEALTLTDILDAINEAVDRKLLGRALRQFILTRPLTVQDAKNPNLTRSAYDYRDNRSFIADLIRCSSESKSFQKETGLILTRLRNKIGKETRVDQALPKWFEYLGQRTQSLIRVSAQEIIFTNNKLKVVGISGEFKRVEAALQKAKNTPLQTTRSIMLTSLVEGEDNARGILDRARTEGIDIAQEVFTKDFKVKCEILDAVSKQGYGTEEAVQKALEYIEGPKGLLVRDNFFLKSLTSILEKEPSIISLKEDDFEMLETSIIFCMERLGYETK